MSTKQVLCAVACLWALAGCSNEQIHGSGRLVEEQRLVGPFTGVEISDRLGAEVGMGENEVTLFLDDNLLPLVRTAVVADTLEIGNPDEGTDLVPSAGAWIRIASPAMDRLSASGSARFTGAVSGGLLALRGSGDSSMVLDVSAGEHVTAQASGMSRVQLFGSAPRIVVDASGEAAVDSAMPCENADVEASGDSRVRLHASQAVWIQASGDSVVTVVGSPAERQVSTSGTAKVVFEESNP
jgi:hypothetical protein